MTSRSLPVTLLFWLMTFSSPSANGQAVDDSLVDLNGHFPMIVPSEKQQLDEQIRSTRDRVRLATGVLPMPELADPTPVIHGRREMDGYTIEKIYFESLPGYFVTGNLYRPIGKSNRPIPGVLCPHGHWREGRFYDAGDSTARKLIADGAERFLSAARNHIQARCVQIARMGCVALYWDMAGYADSDQISMERIHGFRKQDPGIAQTEAGWLLYSAQAENHLQTAMALQTINALQAVRIMQGLPGVDPKRIAITGASGGGTQSFITAAIDESVAAAFPAVMVSTGMQGGCTCENACYLRIGGGNIDIAACIAPRPLGLTAADDWTKTMPSDGYPQLQQVFQQFGAADQLQFTPLLHFGHNYNHVSRVAFYEFLNRVFTLGLDTPVLESDFQRLEPDELTVWNDEHPRPAGGIEFERELLSKWKESTDQQIIAMVKMAPRDQGASYRKVVQTAIDAMVGRSRSQIGVPTFELTSKVEQDDTIVMSGIVAESTRARETKAYFVYPKNWNGGVVIAVHNDGIRAVGEAIRQSDSKLAQAIRSGKCVAAIDLLAPRVQGSERSQPLVRYDRLSAAYTYGYNPPLLIRKVHDVMGFVAFVRNHERQPTRIELIAFGESSPVAIVAGAVLGDWLDACDIEAGDFRFEQIRSIRDPNFLPGGARYLDVPGILALHAPRPLQIHSDNPDAFKTTRALYECVGSGKSLRVVP